MNAHPSEDAMNLHGKPAFPFIVLSAALFLLIFSTTSSGNPLGSWHKRHPFADGISLAGVTYGNDTFVAVGSQGTILMSADGASWEFQSSETTERLIEVVYGDGTFVVLGENGLILTSTDATAWTHRTTLAGGPFWKDFGIAFGNGTFVIAVKDVCYSSQDGITWSVSALTAPGVIGEIAFGNGIFVSVGRTGDEPEDAGAVLTSADEAVWTQQATIPGTGSWRWRLFRERAVHDIREAHRPRVSPGTIQYLGIAERNHVDGDGIPFISAPGRPPPVSATAPMWPWVPKSPFPGMVWRGRKPGRRRRTSSSMGFPSAHLSLLPWDNMARS